MEGHCRLLVQLSQESSAAGTTDPTGTHGICSSELRSLKPCVSFTSPAVHVLLSRALRLRRLSSGASPHTPFWSRCRWSLCSLYVAAWRSGPTEMPRRGEHGPGSRSAAALNVTARAANSRENAHLVSGARCPFPPAPRRKKNNSSPRDTSTFLWREPFQKLRVYSRTGCGDEPTSDPQRPLCRDAFRGPRHSPWPRFSSGEWAR